uniref:Glycine--tRNA ligase n=1 Tax=Aceria tosichella TaxID=561515 RepID=A0A6G1SAC0_9ACAR
MWQLFRTTIRTLKIQSSRLERDIRVANLRGATQRKVYIKNYLTNLIKMNPDIEKILSPLRQDVKEYGDIVRALKEKSAPKVDIEAAVRVLKEKKRLLEAKEASLVPKDSFVDKTRLEDVLKRRFFYDLSFSIYGGVSGLFDYGPPGIALKKNILRQWESHFVLEEDLLEIEASQLTLEPVLKASGHVDRFADLMVKDVKTGDCYRLDHLIKGHLEKVASAKDCTVEKRQEIDRILAQLEGFSQDEFTQTLRKFEMKAPATGNELTDPVEFNLMFATSIGPTGLIKSFLRPETAQGIFVNFKRLLEANQGKLPFGVAQIGKSFRNEISPRGGLVRMREFTMAEIEYFVDPENKTHSKFDSVKNLKLNLYSACNQMNGEPFQNITIEEAVKKGIVANEVLGYFIARISMFMLKIGIDEKKMRFRQHMGNEMAHYATDCWDCECLTTIGWLECIGCADRSCYDLTQHANATNVKLSANRQLKEPKEVEVVECFPQKAILGKLLKENAKLVLDEIAKANKDKISSWEEELKSGMLKLTIGEKTFDIPAESMSVKREKKSVIVEEVVPSVIEPSFGIDRIMYTLMEHNFKIREDNQLRTYFTFPPLVAPTKCSILPLSNNQEFAPFVSEILTKLKSEGVRPKVDTSSESIGRRYARTDEVGIPFGITIDFDTVKDRTVTLRNCETTEQLRADIDEVVLLVRDLSNHKISWSKASEGRLIEVKEK